MSLKGDLETSRSPCHKQSHSKHPSIIRHEPTRKAFSKTYANKTCVVSLGHKRVNFLLSSTLCLRSRRMRLRKDQKMQRWLWLLTSNSPRRRPTTTSKDSHRGLVASLVGKYESSEGVAAAWLTTWYELVRQCRGSSSHLFDESFLAVIEKRSRHHNQNNVGKV